MAFSPERLSQLAAQYRNSIARPDPPFMQGLIPDPKPEPEFPPRQCPLEMHVVQGSSQSPRNSNQLAETIPQGTQSASLSVNAQGNVPPGLALPQVSGPLKPCTACKGTGSVPSEPQEEGVSENRVYHRKQNNVSGEFLDKGQSSSRASGMRSSSQAEGLSNVLAEPPKKVRKIFFSLLKL